MDYSSPLVSPKNRVSEQCNDSAKCNQNGGLSLSSELSCQPSTEDPETLKCASAVSNIDKGLHERRACLRLPLNGIIVGPEEICPLVTSSGEANTCGPEKNLLENGNNLSSIDENDEKCEGGILKENGSVKRPKGIVKSPSERRCSASSRRILFKNDSVLSPKRRSISECMENDRPVLHVQFNNGCTDASVSTAPHGVDASPASSLSESTSSSSSEDDSSLRLTEARPPDGGWGWVIVFATFLVNLIADGVTFSFGVLFVHFLEYFGEGKAKTAWIGSLFMAMPLLSGPIASFLTDRYGCRKMCICGSILACLGFVVSAFTTNMETLFFTFGVVSGFGLSLCYVAAVVIVAYYFEKKRSLATGLSVCGSGIGTFIFAPLTQILLDEYGWRGTTLILAGFFLNITVCGALMRDLEWTTVMAKAKAEDRKRNREQKRLKRYESSADSFSDNKSTNTVGLAQQQQSSMACESENRNVENNSDITRQFSSLVNLPTFVNNGEKVPVEVLELLASKKNVYNVLLQNYPSMLISSRSFSDSGRIHEIGSKHGNTPLGSLHPISEITDDDLNHSIPPPSRPPPAYLKDLRIHRHSLTYRGAMLNINRYRLRASSCPNIYRNSMTTIAKEKLVWYAGLWELWDLLVDMLDFSHFQNSHFLLFAISNFLLYTWYDVPYVYITDNAVELGFSETDASMLISVIGIVNMVGEIILGWVGDWESVDAGFIYACCMVLCGIVTALVPLLKSYLGLCAASGAFGLFIAANYSLTSIILVELITLENFTSAYGLLLLVQGVANLVGPPLAGWIYDLTGTYELSFYLAGLFILLSGLLLLVLPINKRFKKYRALRRKGPASASTSSVEDTSGLATANGTSKSEKNNQIFV